ncbi:hypothetical protein D3218_01700 [Aureimonas flava]|uniref:Phage tail lysozyme domain-containing protein n=1 Tax=Aureimonas flava TaxID=2320271 RepID=A0A3A1WNM2_9HYPH|nr:phage tail tip lysozyme [Aureimonas flava]RIY03498.1 hypothetical protein D3218_01700 [Aureimonas flava]
MALPQFIFGGDTGMTPAQLKKNRAIAEALREGASRAPRNVGEGISAIGQALAYRIREGQNDKAEKALGEKQREISGTLGQEYAAALAGGGSDFGAGAGFGSATGPIGDASTAIPAGERATYIRSGLVSRGLPEHVADGFLANFEDESGLDPGINERNPTVPGSRGGFGLYQLTGPRRDAYEGFAASRGVDPSDIDTQLDFMVGELGVGEGAKEAPWYGSEGKAARSIMAAPDTAGAAQAIVNNFLRPAPEHRSSRAAKYARLAGAAAPVQVASLDRAAGMSSVPEFGAEDVAALEARPKDPRAVPYQGPGATIDPRDVERFQPGNVLAAPGSMSPEDQRLYDERIRGRGAQPDPAGTVPYAGPGARIDDPNAMQGGRQPPQRADPPGTKNMAVARALGIQPQPFTPPSMSAVASALNGRPVPTPTPRPEQMADAQPGADPSQGGDPWAGMRPQDIARQSGALQVAQANASQPSPFDVARANGQTIETDAPTYMGRSVDTFDPQVLIGVLQNEYASPDQKAMAQDILQLQMRRQQTTQAQQYDMRKTLEGRAYEEQKAARERAAGNEDYLTRKKIDLQFQKPEGVDWQELPNGDYGYFDPQKRQFTKLGNAPKPASSGITIGPDGTVQIGGGPKLPANFMPDPENPGAVKPIPGGPGEQLPAELAGRIAIADSFLGQAGALREQLAAGGATGLLDRFQAGNNASSDQAGIYRQLQSGADALQRLLTGAGMTESEAAIYAGRYLPGYTDSAESAVAKLDQMTREIENARAAALRGRGGIGADVTPNGANAPKGAAADYKTKYGLE